MHLSDGAKARANVVMRLTAASWARAQMHLIIFCLGSSAGVLDRSSVRSIALTVTFYSSTYFHPQTAFSVNDLQHTKIPKLTKTLKNNKVRSLTNIS